MTNTICQEVTDTSAMIARNSGAFFKENIGASTSRQLKRDLEKSNDENVRQHDNYEYVIPFVSLCLSSLFLFLHFQCR